MNVLFYMIDYLVKFSKSAAKVVNYRLEKDDFLQVSKTFFSFGELNILYLEKFIINQLNFYHAISIIYLSRNFYQLHF